MQCSMTEFRHRFRPKFTGADPPFVVLVHGLGIFRFQTGVFRGVFRFEIGEVGLGVGGSGGAMGSVDSALTTAYPSYPEGNRPLGTPMYQHI